MVYENRIPGKDWVNLKSLASIICSLEINHIFTQKVRYHVSPLEVYASKISRTIRCHWHVENSLHWIMDVTLKEMEKPFMIKKGKTTLVLLTAVSLSHAGAMSGVVSASYQQNAYIKLGAGGSASMSSHIDTDPLYWATSPQGYNNNIGSTALYSAAVGYNFCELMSADFEYTYRPSYSYSKYQTSTATGTVDLFGNKTRYFNLESNSIMANVYAHGQGISSNLVRRVSDNSIVQPFLGGGLGVSYNTMSALRSVAPNGTIATLSPYRKRASFAWQLSTGIELISTNHLQLAAGYRYYNGGTYKSQNFSSGQSVTPWTGKLQANEGFMTITYQLPT